MMNMSPLRTTVLSLPFALYASQLHAQAAPHPDPAEFSVIIDASDSQPVGGEVSACTADGQMRIVGYFTLSALPQDLEEIYKNPDNHFDEIYHLETVASFAIHASIASMPEGQLMEEDGYRQLMRRVFNMMDKINNTDDTPKEDVMGLGLNFQPTELQEENHRCPRPPSFRA